MICNKVLPLKPLSNFCLTLKFLYIRRFRILPLTQEQKQIVLKTLNEATDKELFDFNLSPKLRNKIIFEKGASENNIFTHFTQLNDFGFGKLKIQILSNIILGAHYSSKELQNLIASTLPNLKERNLLVNTDFGSFTNVESNLNKGKKNKSKIKDWLIADFNKDCIPFPTKNVIISLSISFPDVGWAIMNGDGEILDLSCDVFDMNTDILSKVLNLHIFYEKVSSILRMLPEYDFVVTEIPFVQSRDATSLRMNTLLQGMFMAFFDKKGTDQCDYHPVIFFKSHILDRLYNIKVGNVRKSLKEMGDEILAGKSMVSWMKPLKLSSKPLEKYILSSAEEKQSLVHSLLIAAAFDHLLLKRDKCTLSALN